MVDQQDARGEGVGLGELLAAADPTAQRLEGFHEFLISIRGAVERPAFAEQTPATIILGGNFQADRACGLFGNRYARWRDPHARERTAEARVLQRIARSVAILAVADQQQLKTAGAV